LWDYDTLAQERARFPSALELVSGKFLRHSDEFYAWRVADREARLEAGDHSPELYDDLAVALSKLGEDGRAIELMIAKEALHPGLYESAANLGTFYIHDGQLESGIEHIERALELNPDAHFGRERYQLYLARYVLERRALEGAPGLPLHPNSDGLDRVGANYWDFVARQKGLDPEKAVEHSEVVQAAVQGVLGMLRFGNHDSPVLLEVLSDLLMADWNSDAKLLAGRALLKAAAGCEDEAQREAYREKARQALNMQTPGPRVSRNMSLEELEARFALELEEAREFAEAVRADELRWIEAGQDVDAEFAAKYYQEPHVGDAGRGSAWSRGWRYLVVGCLVAALGGYAMLRRRRALLGA